MAEATPTRRFAAKPLVFEGPAPPVTIGEREIAVETPIAIVYGGLSYAVMMATPADLDDFVVGFSLTEGVVDAPEDIRGIALTATPEGIEARVDLVAERMTRHLARRRAMTGRSGCGLCGVADLASLQRPAQAAAQPLLQMSPAAVGAALRALDDAQPLNQRTHALHAAAFADPQGRLRTVREDVGRHNALDKLAGALVRGRIDPGDGFVVITSRCSFEMVDKAAALGARLLVAVSAPTSLAIERAQDRGLALVAVARRDFGLIFAEGADTSAP